MRAFRTEVMADSEGHIPGIDYIVQALDSLDADLDDGMADLNPAGYKQQRRV